MAASNITQHLMRSAALQILVVLSACAKEQEFESKQVKVEVRDPQPVYSDVSIDVQAGAVSCETESKSGIANIEKRKKAAIYLANNCPQASAVQQSNDAVHLEVVLDVGPNMRSSGFDKVFIEQLSKVCKIFEGAPASLLVEVTTFDDAVQNTKSFRPKNIPSASVPEAIDLCSETILKQVHTWFIEPVTQVSKDNIAVLKNSPVNAGFTAFFARLNALSKLKNSGDKAPADRPQRLFWFVSNVPSLVPKYVPVQYEDDARPAVMLTVSNELPAEIPQGFPSARTQAELVVSGLGLQLLENESKDPAKLGALYEDVLKNWAASKGTGGENCLIVGWKILSKDEQILQEIKLTEQKSDSGFQLVPLPQGADRLKILRQCASAATARETDLKLLFGN